LENESRPKAEQTCEKLFVESKHGEKDHRGQTSWREQVGKVCGGGIKLVYFMLILVLQIASHRLWIAADANFQPQFVFPVLEIHVTGLCIIDIPISNQDGNKDTT
jgi:hypothetical protein